jgi:hypothetical protein
MGKGRNHRLGGGEGSKGERRRFDGRGKDNTGKFGLRRNRGGDKLKPVPFSENSAEAASISVYKRPTVYPAAYIGPAQPLPHVGFVEPSNKDTYEQLLATSYKGFVHDSPHVHDDAFHRDFRQAFETVRTGDNSPGPSAPASARFSNSKTAHQCIPLSLPLSISLPLPLARWMEETYSNMT